MLALLSIQAIVVDPEALDRFPANDVLIDDLVHVSRCHATVPDRLGINDDVGPVLALVKASGFVGTYSALKAALGDGCLE